MLALFGLGSAGLALVDPIPYVRDIFRGTTKPHRGSWLVWSVLGITAFTSQLADGAGWSLAMVGGQAMSTTLVLGLSLRHGVGGVGRLDLVLLTGAALGVAGWLVSDDPVVATVLVVVADTAGVAMMLPKTWRDPWSETLSTYVLASGSGVLSAAAVGGLDGSLLLYPVYFALANGATSAVIAGRRRALTPAAAEAFAT